ncbi:hypothetical protein [Lentzea flaviverrucosa]|uniref:Uncharacterized protein n=1 Tax=Lentzea flaviverrucosa TaxID=200379 RepID=A0A1H9LWA0_9PSEU|nr:hypothetical protein [Lentzea flaviverrucosa]RDI31167.1 hypothetical protein DFR72_104504 [Lentzea flaviverrucosa]SER15638.1 hypothetical protein SAMN05216195_104122 [Lentzea flaviverrucosa]
MRVVTAAVVGALCAAAWSMSFVPIGKSLCVGTSAMGCVGLIFLWVAPISAVVWAVVVWALLRLARWRPVWPTAVLGPVVSFVLALAAGLTAVGMRLRPSENDSVLVVTITTGIGYALAAAVTGGYGGRRDGAEHRGQDG